jgi:hypothetical protein
MAERKRMLHDSTHGVFLLNAVSKEVKLSSKLAVQACTFMCVNSRQSTIRQWHPSFTQILFLDVCLRVQILLFGVISTKI